MLEINIRSDYSGKELNAYLLDALRDSEKLKEFSKTAAVRTFQTEHLTFTVLKQKLL